MAPLTDGQVGIWYVRTKEVDDATLATIRDLLTAEEKKKHLAYRFEKNRIEYLVTRGLERSVLATCLSVRPADLAFVRNEYGRPELTPASPLRFNLTNTVAMVTCAVTLGREIGVDAEPLSRCDEILDIATTVFTIDELTMLDSLDLEARRRRAVELWTLKEAYMKARGMGMSIPPDKFTIAGGGSAPRLHAFHAPIVDDPMRWLLATREITDHLVSFCVERRDHDGTSGLAIDIEHADLRKMLGEARY